jgi:hypothetical protein
VDFAWAWAGWLVRQRWRTTILVALLCGLAAGVAMAATAAGRRSATAFDELLAFADPPETILNVCPPEVTELDEASFEQCVSYVPARERDVIASLPEVEEAVVASFRGATIVRAGSADPPHLEVAMVTYQAGAARLDGRQLLVAGRPYDPNAPDEVVVNERVFAELGLALGDEIELTFWGEDELGQLSPDGAFHGERVRAAVVGVVRGIIELGDNQTESSYTELSVLAGPGVARATPDTLGYTGILVRAAGGDSVAAEAAISAALPDMLANVAAAVEEDEIDPIRDAIRYEAYGVTVFGALAALAAAVFCGQAIARQTRREWQDLPTLRALGVTGTQVRRAALARTAAVAVLAIAVAVVATVALSPMGPVGVARGAELDPGVEADWAVLGVGSLLVAAVVLGACAATIRRLDAARPRRAADERSWIVGWLPPTVTAGLALSRPSRRSEGSTPLGTAVTGATLATMTVVAALGIGSSLDGLRAAPERIGAPWDISIATANGDPRATEAREVLADRTEITAAAAIVGTDADIGGRAVWVHAFEPLEGVDAVVPPPILSGRAPASETEIALGAVTARDVGAEIGDTVTLRSTTTRDEARVLTVVGTAIVNDTYESCGGCGGVVAPAFIDAFAPEAEPDPMVFQLAPGTDVGAVRRELGEIYPRGALGPVAQQAVRNVERIRELPALLALLSSALAVASVAHALVLSLRRNRATLAVLRSIGFTRRQVRTVVATHAASLGVLAVTVGGPLGVVLGRQGWRMLTDRIGVAFVPEIPLGATLVALAAVVATVVGIALIPGWSALRARPSATLRAE